MKVRNLCSFPVCAFVWDKRLGAGFPSVIEPNTEAEPKGPFVGEMGGGMCFLALPGEITVHEGDDEPGKFNVSLGNPLCLGSTGVDSENGITIHHKDEKLPP